MRLAGGDWMYARGYYDGTDPSFTAQRHNGVYNFYGAWLRSSYVSMYADDWYY